LLSKPLMILVLVVAYRTVNLPNTRHDLTNGG
jgi:hypothetical protein